MIIRRSDYYLVKCQYKLVFSEYQYCPYVTSKISDNKTLMPRKSWLEEVIDGSKNKGYTFNYITEMHLITFAIKMDMSNDFYIKHNMHAVQWKLNAMINKDKNLINKLNPYWRHPLVRKFQSYRVRSINQVNKLTINIYSNLSNINKQYYRKLRIPIRRPKNASSHF